MVLKSTKENNITTFLIDKITESLDNVLVFCDERKDDESLEILLNLNKNQIEVYQTSVIRPDRLYNPSEGLDWVDQKFHNKNGSVPDYIVLSGGFLAINLDIHSDDNILSLREYVLYFIKNKILPEIALRGVYSYYCKSSVSGRFFDSFTTNYFYISALFCHYGEIPEEFGAVLDDVFLAETKSGLYKYVELYKKSIVNWYDSQGKVHCFYNLLSSITKKGSRASRWLTKEFVKIASEFTKEEKDLLFDLAILSFVGISSYEEEDPYSSVAYTHQINYKLFYTIENICDERFSNLLPEYQRNSLLSFDNLADFSNKSKNSFPVYFFEDCDERINRAIDVYQRLLVEDGYQEEDLIPGKILAIIYRYCWNMKLTETLISTDFSRKRIRFEISESYYYTYLNFLVEYFGKKLNPKSVVVTGSSSLLNINSRTKNDLLKYPIFFSDVEKIIIESIDLAPNPYYEKFREEFLASSYNQNNNISIVFGTTPELPIDIVINDLVL